MTEYMDSFYYWLEISEESRRKNNGRTNWTCQMNAISRKKAKKYSEKPGLVISAVLYESKTVHTAHIVPQNHSQHKFLESIL